MARGRTRLEWNQTAELWALLAEQIRDPQQRHEPYTAQDIHPLAEKKTEVDDGPDLALWSKITQNVELTPINLEKFRHAS